MKTVIISGGTGNDSLIRGLKYYYPSMDCKVIVNAYDNGKSTGICRAVTNTLGVSDIRKNHIRMYLTTTKFPNVSIVEFYENRYDFTPGNEVKEIIEKLERWDLTQFEVYVKHFFERDNSKNYQYTDFNVSNIVYSEMYAEEGYEYTNHYFCKDILGIDDFVLLNSFDNVFITANTKSGYVIDNESKIVNWCNSEDKIKSIDYKSASSFVEEQILNNLVVNAIQEADLLVISTGTFWSSIFPTIDYADMWHVINESKAKKIWAFNCEEDSDSYEVSADEFIDIMINTGLDLSNFTLLFNKDASKLLSNTSYNFNKYCVSMDNIEGKHSAQKYAKAILQIYYGLNNFVPDYILCDFDDTLWPRDRTLVNFGINNLGILNDLGKEIIVIIISGNSYSSIVKKLSTVYGEELAGFNITIWADASSTEFINGNVNHKISSCFICNEKAKLICEYFKTKFDIISVNDILEDVPFIKFKPLTEKERKLIVELFNSFLRYYFNCTELKAVSTGRTTVDIVTDQDNKVKVFEELGIRNYNTLYIGDEINSGNDKEIASKVSLSIHTSGVEETSCILRVI